MRIQSIISLVILGVVAKTAFAESEELQFDTGLEENVMLANPTDGWKEVPYDFLYNYPYDLDISDRHTLSGTQHHFWVYDYDKSHDPSSDTHPRCELSMKNHYTSGKHQLEADYKVPAGTTGVCIT